MFAMLVLSLLCRALPLGGQLRLSRIVVLLRNRSKTISLARTGVRQAACLIHYWKLASVFSAGGQALKDDQEFQKLVRCGQFLAKMFAGGTF
jgi:hypothetical protein